METYDQTPIEIYDHDKKLTNELALLDHEPAISDANKQTLDQFIRDARVGRTVRRGARRRLSAARCRKLLTALKTFAMHIDRPFEELTVEGMERFVLDLEEGRIQKRNPVGHSRRYKSSTVADIKKVLRKFYRWLLPGEENEARVRELTGWFDMREEVPELFTFGWTEVQRMMQAARGPAERTLLVVLFDGGFRASELLNIRLYDVTFPKGADGRRCAQVRIRISKTRPRTVMLPLADHDLRFWVEHHPGGGPIEESGRIAAKNPSATLIPWTYHYCRKIVARIGKILLKQHVHLHRFRHASATFWAKRLSHYELAARMGWAMGSRAVQRYVDHSGVLGDGVIDKVQDLVGAAAPVGTSGTHVVDIDTILRDPRLLAAAVRSYASRHGWSDHRN